MLKIAWKTLRARRSSLVGTLIVLIAASAILTTSAVLAESGLRSSVESYRYDNADAIVTADRTFTPEGGDFTTSTQLPDQPKVPVALSAEIGKLDEVELAIIYTPMSLATSSFLLVPKLYKQFLNYIFMSRPDLSL